MAYPGLTHCSECGEPLEGKYKLIDILNKIANEELKIDSKVIWGGEIYTYYGDDDFHKCGSEFETDLWEDMFIGSLNEEVELIEPNDFGKADKMAEHNHFADDGKMADNTKIEELDILEIEDSQNIDNIGLANSIGDLSNAIREIQHKLNEVINKVNAQTTVVLSHEKDIANIKSDLDY